MLLSFSLSPVGVTFVNLSAVGISESPADDNMLVVMTFICVLRKKKTFIAQWETAEVD